MQTRLLHLVNLPNSRHRQL
ncbi:hypothetical protein MAR_005433 [Mya arenaria]|uniref:Uncharacterized protein n=1 Tax=Mya arenaria TaxID=6604 RepID=A0ABY7EZI2_MYAAR|nr:hypothetical protein MAR_005433 [Mya arenaria]